MKKFFSIFIAYFLIAATGIKAQEFISLWPKGKMPNTKGMQLKDSIVNERAIQIATPGFYAFFPSKDDNNGTAVLIFPGGGYHHLTYNLGGFQLAKWFNTMGISAFVVSYRLPTSPDLKQKEIGPLQDAQRAMRIIRANAVKWKINPGKIGVQGSSAGGHLAMLLAVSDTDYSSIGDTIDTLSFLPDFTILVSPVVDMGQYAHAGSRQNLLGEKPSDEMIARYSNQLHISKSTAPSFIVHAFNDMSVSVRNSLMLYDALVENGVVSSLHIFPKGGHSIALRNNPGSTEQWTGLCEAWLVEMDFIKRTLTK